jgi:hypothetical protein
VVFVSIVLTRKDDFKTAVDRKTVVASSDTLDHGICHFLESGSDNEITYHLCRLEYLVLRPKPYYVDGATGTAVHFRQAPPSTSM